jgi:hypothetical protein
VGATDRGVYDAHRVRGGTGSAHQQTICRDHVTFLQWREVVHRLVGVGASPVLRPDRFNSNARCKHQNDADADDQNGQRRPIVFEPRPILTELIHDGRPLLRAILSFRAKMAPRDGFGCLVAPAVRKVQNFVALGLSQGRISPEPYAI